MDNQLSSVTMHAFVVEMTKEAKLVGLLRGFPKSLMSRAKHLGRKTKGGLFGDLEEATRRLHPIKGPREGWRLMSPRQSELVGKAGLTGDKQRAFREAQGQFLGKARQAGTAERAWAGEKSWKNLKKYLGSSAFGPGSHMARHKAGPVSLPQILSGRFKGPGASQLGGELESGSRLRMLAEELSRRGWTGAGRATKYMPVGQKGIAGAFTASAVPHIMEAKDPSRTGEGGALQRGLGELGGAAGFVAGTGLGLAPALGLWWGADKAGGKLGKILDRLRAGASMQEAVEAPTEEEAQQQLAKIIQYHGTADADS